MRVAVVGCAHGQIEMIANEVDRINRQNESQHMKKIDLIICCGDFQACRSVDDLSCMSCPLKYRDMGSFYKYYFGHLKLSIPMIVIGGNHEASNHNLELYYGGWLAPNIYYLGNVGSILFGGLRISGVSGIFKYHDFDKAIGEECPLNKNDIYSIYHTRRFHIWQLSMLHGNLIDIFMSHDWPSHIWKYGDYQRLINKKKHFIKDIGNHKMGNHLGNPSLNHLLFQLQPKYWFSGHLHCFFKANVYHKDTKCNTHFFATSKCNVDYPHHKFIELVDIDVSGNVNGGKATFEFEYDPVWLAILKKTNKFLNVSWDVSGSMVFDKETIDKFSSGGNGGKGFGFDFRPSKEEIDEIKVKLFNNDLKIPKNFQVLVNDPTKELKNNNINSSNSNNNYNKNGNNNGFYFSRNMIVNGRPPMFIFNPQTELFCQKLQIIDKIGIKHKNMYHQSRFNRNINMNTNMNTNINTNINTNTNNSNVNIGNIGNIVENKTDDIDIGMNNNINNSNNNNNNNNNERNTIETIDDWADDIFAPQLENSSISNSNNNINDNKTNQEKEKEKETSKEKVVQYESIESMVVVNESIQTKDKEKQEKQEQEKERQRVASLLLQLPPPKNAPR